MNIQVGLFYFVDDRYLEALGDKTIMKNKKADKDGDHDRPVYCAIKLDEYDYYWVIPISSKVKKYRAIYNKKIERYGKCDTLDFGYVLGEERAFLIQNMYPALKEYFTNIYIDKTTNKPVTISNSIKNRLKSKANRVLSLYKRKGINLTFTDLDRILELLRRF